MLSELEARAFDEIRDRYRRHASAQSSMFRLGSYAVRGLVLFAAATIVAAGVDGATSGTRRTGST